MQKFQQYDISLDISQQKINDLFSLASFDKKAQENIRNLAKLLKQKDYDEMINVFYSKLLKFDYAKSFFENENLLSRVKVKQAEYFQKFFNDEYDQEFFADRRNLGAIHERIGLDNFWYLAAYTIFFEKLVEHAMKNAKSQEEGIETVKSLGKLVLMDVGAVITSYLESRENIIKAQSQEVLELSSPVLKLTDDITIIPLLGTLDSVRALGIMEKILSSLEKSQTRVVIIDITGVPLIDTSTGANLVRTVSAVNLMGSEVIITGLSPKLASTIVELGINLSTLKTRSNLATGLAEALKIVNASK